jgi:membrane dipeptidase
VPRDGDAPRLHDEAVVVDCHNDLILHVAREKSLGRPDTFRDYWIPNLRRGGVDVQVVPLYGEPEYFPESSLRRSLKLIRLLHQEVEKNSDEVALCSDGGEVDEATSSGKIALIMAFEGSASIGEDVELFETFFRLGLRMASFSWFGRTLLADGSGEGQTGGRLTRAGVAALAELERLGIIMDVSHLSMAGTDHVLELATRPVIASHSSARALCDHHRNLYDEQLKAIAATGGVVGVVFFPGFVDPSNPVVDRIVDHISHVADVAGIDHVGMGPDFIGEYVEALYPNEPGLTIEGLDATARIEGLETSGDLPLITEAMLDRGFASSDIQKVLGGNFLRVFRELMGVPAGSNPRVR